jgi:hypothetical protein
MKVGGNIKTIGFFYSGCAEIFVKEIRKEALKNPH